jgi:hypothetical protein
VCFYILFEIRNILVGAHILFKQQLCYLWKKLSFSRYLLKLIAHLFSLSLKNKVYIQCGNFNGIKFITWTWAIFVKNPETGRFLFFLAYILVHMVFAYLLPEVRNHP